MNLPALPLRAVALVPLFARSVTVLAFAACALAFAAPARANNISVNGLGDALSNNGVCTLREAVINANNDAATWPDCAAGSGADIININPAGTITFAIANVPALGDSDQLAARGDLDLYLDGARRGRERAEAGGEHKSGDGARGGAAGQSG